MKKNIVMIGGSHGIGLQIVQELMADYEVYVASRSLGALEGLNVNHITFDAVTGTFMTKELPNEIDGFVYCPGSINLKPFKMMSLDTFKEDMQLNFFSLLNVVKEIVPKMTKGGSMVFFSTVAVGTGMPFHTSIAAAKGAIEGFARSLAAEYAPNMRVNVIAPSLVDTPLAGRLLSSESKRELLSQRHPLKRIGEPADIANLAVFLLSDKSSWMTGQVIKVDGGIGTLNIS
ncbi:MAG: SDR family oxidoreductase [Maribacter sp.]|nr:SDR family oxidoreductase [Maribacter sp.]